jgi:hypothetical protein
MQCNGSQQRAAFGGARGARRHVGYSCWIKSCQLASGKKRGRASSDAPSGVWRQQQDIQAERQPGWSHMPKGGKRALPAYRHGCDTARLSAAGQPPAAAGPKKPRRLPWWAYASREQDNVRRKQARLAVQPPCLSAHAMGPIVGLTAQPTAAHSSLVRRTFNDVLGVICPDQSWTKPLSLPCADQWLLKLSGIGGGAKLSSVKVWGWLLLGEATLFYEATQAACWGLGQRAVDAGIATGLGCS